jgi:endonuclease YncB( thermonuclease family)
VGRRSPFRRRPAKLRFWPEDRVTVRGVARETWWWLGKLRPFIFAGIAFVAWAGADPALVEPPAFLSTEPELVNRTFQRCDRPHGYACVSDGDTFRLGQRRIRIIGIDAPETPPPRCAEEKRLGEAATAKLQELLNDGEFEMVGRVGDMKDRYGRDLRVVRRLKADGSYASVAGQMRDSGLARRYLGDFRRGWC